MRSLDLTELNLLFEKPHQKSQIPARSPAHLPLNKCPQERVTRLRLVSSTGNLLTKSRAIWGDDGLPMSDTRADMRQCPILARHNEYFIDYFQKRVRLGRTWVDAKLHFSVMEKLGPARSSSTLNPHAEPFVSNRRWNPIPFHKLGFNEPAWFPAFLAGTRYTTGEADPGYEVVSHRNWTRDSITELAKYFCWKAGEGVSLDHERIVNFAKAVHIRFGASYGDWYAQEFTWCMREYAVAAFKALWKSEPPSLADNIAYVSSGLSLAAFIGDLFAHELLPASQVHVCLSFLLEQAKSIEHIHATHILLLHAGKKVWEVQNARGFVTSFIKRIGNVDGCGKSSLIAKREVKATEVAAWLHEIQNMVLGWKLQGFVVSRSAS